MLAMLYAYLCVPSRFRSLVRWLAVLFVLVVFVMIVILFYRAILSLPKQHKKPVPSTAASATPPSKPSLALYTLRREEAA